MAEAAGDLDILSDLVGTWKGPGFNQIMLPDFAGGKPFKTLLNSTVETLEFSGDIGPVPNRGAKQADIVLHGVRYFQSVKDAADGKASAVCWTPALPPPAISACSQVIHQEPGFWLRFPETTDPASSVSFVRQAAIPHGVSILLQGQGFVVKEPIIDVVSTKPIRVDGSPILGYGDGPDLSVAVPAGTPAGAPANPNVVLTDALEKQKAAGEKIVKTVVLDVRSGPAADGTGISNIAFLQPGGPAPTAPDNNAAVTQVSSIFWIETVELPGGGQVLQLQYSQTVILNFGGVNWCVRGGCRCVPAGGSQHCAPCRPHVSVATLRKISSDGPRD